MPCDATATISDGWSSVEYESEPIFPEFRRLAKGFAYTQSNGDSGNINSGGAIHRTYVYAEGGPASIPAIRSAAKGWTGQKPIRRAPGA